MLNILCSRRHEIVIFVGILQFVTDPINSIFFLRHRVDSLLRESDMLAICPMFPSEPSFLGLGRTACEFIISPSLTGLNTILLLVRITFLVLTPTCV